VERSGVEAESGETGPYLAGGTWAVLRSGEERSGTTMPEERIARRARKDREVNAKSWPYYRQRIRMSMRFAAGTEDKHQESIAPDGFFLLV
jgi:hypothetical protein